MSKDIALCQDHTCPARHECLRYSVSKDKYAVYSLFQEFKKDKKGRCKYFIPRKESNNGLSAH